MDRIAPGEYCEAFSRPMGENGWPAGLCALDIALTLRDVFGRDEAVRFCRAALGYDELALSPYMVEC